MQRSVLTAGIFNEFSSSGFIGIIVIAPAGQLREHKPHDTPSVSTIQLSLIHTALPIWIEDFSSLVILHIAPVGQTSEQRVHSGRQYPRSYELSGCINVERSEEGLNTLLGHSETHS